MILNKHVCLSAGVAADAKVGSDLIRVQAIDNDVGNNSLVLYHILSIRYIKLQSNDSEDIGNVFIIGVYRLLATIYDFIFVSFRKCKYISMPLTNHQWKSAMV